MTAKTDFKKNGFCVVKSAISNELRDFITQYALFREMQDLEGTQKGDAQSKSHSTYGDPAMEVMLLHIHDIMEKNTGLELYPTYSYFRIYEAGDILEAHVDREACEISASLCFNYSYDSKKLSWPLYIDGVPVVLEPGDLVIYNGCTIDHWRERFDAGADDWHVQGFFHYVDANGPYAHWKYDQRETVGAVNDFKWAKSNHQKQDLPEYITYTK